MNNQIFFFWASNIKHLRNRKKLSQDELSEKLQISRSKLNAHENGQSKNPPVEDLVRFSEFFRISIDSLLKVDLSKLSELKLRELEAGNDVYMTGTQIRVLATTVNADNNENVEYVPVKAKAGYLAGYGDPEFIGQLPVFNLPHLPKDRKYRMFQTKGDSMYPIPENAEVIGEYITDWRDIKDDTPCIVITKNEGFVFKLVSSRIAARNVLVLKSLNELYAPYEVDPAEVVELWRYKYHFTDQIPAPATPMEQVARDVQEIKAALLQQMKK